MYKNISPAAPIDLVDQLSSCPLSPFASLLASTLSSDIWQKKGVFSFPFIETVVSQASNHSFYLLNS